MRIKIETYRGHEIEYDDSSDKFICQMVIEDNFREKTSMKLSEVRKSIDQFIKLNLEFKPFSFISESYRRIDIVAIRTDGKFVDSEKNQWSLKGITAGTRWGAGGGGSFAIDYDVITELEALDQRFEDFGIKYENEKSAIRSKLKPFDTSFLEQYQTSK